MPHYAASHLGIHYGNYITHLWVTSMQKLYLNDHTADVFSDQRVSYMVWEINMGVCPRLEFDKIMLFNSLGYDLYIYGAFECLCNPLLIYDVLNDITIIP